MQNLRAFDRMDFCGRVGITREGFPAFEVWGNDLSENGIFLQTTGVFAVGEKVSLSFDLDGEAIEVTAAEVAWVRPFEPINVKGDLPGIGVRFVQLDENSRRTLRTFVESEVAETTLPRSARFSDTQKMFAAPGPSIPPIKPLTVAPVPATPQPAGQKKTASHEHQPEPAPPPHPKPRAPSPATDPWASWSFKKLDDGGHQRIVPSAPPQPAEEMAMAEPPFDEEAVSVVPALEMTPTVETEPYARPVIVMPEAPDLSAERSHLTPMPAPYPQLSAEGSGEPAEDDTDAFLLENQAEHDVVSGEHDRYTLAFETPSEGVRRPHRAKRSKLRSRWTQLGLVTVGAAAGLFFGLADDPARPAPTAAPGDIENAAADVAPRSVADAERALRTEPPAAPGKPNAVAEKAAPAPALVEEAVAPVAPAAPAEVPPAPPAEPAKVAQGAAPPAAQAPAAPVAATGAPAPRHAEPPVSADPYAEPARQGRRMRDVALTAPAHDTLRAKLRIERGQVDLKLQGGDIVRTFALQNPPRVVVDLVGSKYPGFRNQAINTKGVKRLRIGRPDDTHVRVVVELSGNEKPRGILADKSSSHLMVRWR